MGTFKRKIWRFATLTLVVFLLMACAFGCSADTNGEATGEPATQTPAETTEETPSESTTDEQPSDASSSEAAAGNGGELTPEDIAEISLDLGTAVYKDITMDEGIEGVTIEAIQLTEEEKEEIRGMGLEVAVEFGANGDTYKWMNAGIDEACADLGITVADTWYSTDQATVTQLEDYQKILPIAENYDALLTLPMDAASQSETLLEIQKKTTVAYMSTAPFGVDWYGDPNFVGVADVDAYKAGQMTAKAAVKMLGEEGGKIGTIGFIAGHEGSLLTCQLRYDGWDKILSEYPNIEVVQAWYDAPDKAKPVAQSLISANPDIDILLVDWSNPAGNQTMQVLNELGYTSDDIKCIFIDLDDTTAVPMAMEADGISYSLVAQPWYAVGRDCVYQYAYHLLHPEDTPKFIASTPMPIATHYNIKNVYENSVPSTYEIPEEITGLTDQWDPSSYMPQ